MPYVIRLKDGTEIVAETAADLAKALQSLGLRPFDHRLPGSGGGGDPAGPVLEKSAAKVLLSLLTHLASHESGTTAPEIAKVIGAGGGRAVSGRKMLWQSILEGMGFQYEEVVRMKRVRGQRYWFPGKAIDRAILKLREKTK